MNNEIETVAVPVELLERFKLDNYARVLTAAEKELVTLIPNPKPRLVAVPAALDDWQFDSSNQTSDEYLESQPDLLTLLDDLIDVVSTRAGWLDKEQARYVKSDIRTALGVTK